MKIIPKMQSGGGMPPFTYYTPVTVPDTSGTVTTGDTTSTSDGSDTTKGQITDKDLMTMIKDIDGLPNDMNNLVESLSNFYTMGNLFYDGKINTSRLSNQYLSALRKVKVANFNKEQFDLAQKKAGENGGLSEIAITPTGKLIVQDQEGELKQITSDEYVNNKDKYYALTNSNLLSLRANSPQFAFNNDILSVVENGIGMSAVTSIIDEAIANLGTNSISKEGYSARQESQITKGIEILQEAASKGVSLEGISLDGLYKTKLITKDQYQQAQQAVKYIYNMLPSNARTLLEVKSGNVDNPKQGSLDLIANLVMSKTTSDIDFQLDYQDDLNPDGSSKKSNTDSTDVKSNPLLNMIQGIGGEDTSIVMNPGSAYQQSVNGKSYSAQDMSNSQYITQTSLQDMLVRSGVGNIVSQNGAITFGDQQISVDNLKNIVYRGTGLKRAILPSKVENGKVVVDLSLVGEYQAAQSEMEQIPENTSDVERNKQLAQILHNHGLDELLDPSTGLPNPRRFSVFLVTDGYATSKDDVVKKSDYVEEIDADDKLYDDINRALSTKDNPYEADAPSWYPGDWFGWYDDVFSGTIYIPISTNQLQGIQGFGDQVKQETAYNQEANYQRAQKWRNAQSTGSNVL